MDFLNRAIDRFRGLGIVVQGLLVLAVVGLAVVGGSYYYPGTGDSTVPIGPDMPVEEVKAVADRLTAAGIPNKLDRRGLNVLVPQDRHVEAKVLLAAEGLPSRTGEGFESFKESSFGATPFQLTVNYQRALQNELARAVTQIDAVAGARVLIARPEPTPFIRDQRPPTASVVLRLKPNVAFSKAAAGSVVALVAHAVDGLKAENVTVVDSTGRMLSDPYAAHRDDLPLEMVDYRQNLEKYLAQKAQEVLTKALGTGRAVVTVNTDLNYQKVRERQKKYAPDEKVLIAERLTQNKTTSTSARGTAGVASNAARPGGTAGSGPAGQSSEETTSSDYASSVTEREIEDKMGAVTRLTVAAVVDLAPAPPADGSAAATEPLMTADDVQGLIKQAIGFQPGRDEIKVANMKMVSPVPPIPEADAGEEEDEKQRQQLQRYVVLARNVSLAVAAVVAFAIVPLVLLRRSRPAKPPETPAPPPPTPEQLAAAARDRRRQQLDQLAELTRSKPDAVSEVFALLVSK